MAKDTLTPIASILSKSSADIIENWVSLQLANKNRSQAVSDSSLTTSSNEFFKLFQAAAKDGNIENLNTPEWSAVKLMLSDLSVSRARLGSSPSETASFVLSFKQPLFEQLNKDFGNDPSLAKMSWALSVLIDDLALVTTEAFQKTREDIIRRQQKDILEMSTPVIKMWEGIVAVPLIGTLDSARTQIVMENLLQKIVDIGAKIAILDITGVPTVDTQTAQHLIKTVSATRLMGAECIISGIRPQIAQTIVHLGIEIHDIVTRATMEDALREAMARVGWYSYKEADAKDEVR
ncbi:STAS domain-containing protein [Candidatus Obscuribacterales bacterium]|nr:STAS domain-containing protein [Candidatus Obscuribacterales bacterium]MBX3152594.1 STAS domain-containing protein [Candidatus Obscuribacterales bacterium]